MKLQGASKKETHGTGVFCEFCETFENTFLNDQVYSGLSEDITKTTFILSVRNVVANWCN